MLDADSSMKEAAEKDLTARMAARIRSLRARRSLSLEGLAAKSGVSRSMISLIERAESSPTAVVLERIAAGLGVMLADLFEREGEAAQERGPVARRADQTEWRDPQSGYVRRNVSPANAGQPVQIVEVSFPAGARISFETGAREMQVWQQIWILQGAMVITHGQVRHDLQEGDCLAMVLDQPTMFHNATRKAARYAVVITTGVEARR